MQQNIYDDEEFSKQYDNLRQKEKTSNANELIEIPNFRKLMPDVKEKTILDLGCGYGENDSYYKSLGAKSVLGIDISKHMIEVANKENKLDGIEYKILPMEDISKINEKFDIVMSSLAFHYVEDFNKLIHDIRNLLNKNGYLVFSQEHPFTTCTKYTDSLKHGYTYIEGKYFGVFSDYNVPGKRTKEWFGKNVEKYHRNFEEIINTLIDNEFVIERVLEPKPTQTVIEHNPKYKNQLDRPFFLFVRAKAK